MFFVTLRVFPIIIIAYDTHMLLQIKIFLTLQILQISFINKLAEYVKPGDSMKENSNVYSGDTIVAKLSYYIYMQGLRKCHA
jgi:hypothetical protein